MYKHLVIGTISHNCLTSVSGKVLPTQMTSPILPGSMFLFNHLLKKHMSAPL